MLGATPLYMWRDGDTLAERCAMVGLVTTKGCTRRDLAAALGVHENTVQRVVRASAEGVGQSVHPAVEVALDVGGAEPHRSTPKGGGVSHGSDAVVEWLVVDLLSRQLALEPLVAVEPYAHAPGRVGADLDEARTPVVVEDVEVQ